MARILVVEDDRELGLLLADYLELIGHDVAVESGVAAARERLDEVSMLITDVTLGDGSGLELCRAASPSMSVIVLSGDPRNRSVAAAMGAAHFFRKPVDVALLGDLVERLAIAD